MEIRRHARVACQYLGLIEGPGAVRRPRPPRRWRILALAVAVLLYVVVFTSLRLLGVSDLLAIAVSSVPFGPVHGLVLSRLTGPETSA